MAGLGKTRFDLIFVYRLHISQIIRDGGDLIDWPLTPWLVRFNFIFVYKPHISQIIRDGGDLMDWPLTPWQCQQLHNTSPLSSHIGSYSSAARKQTVTAYLKSEQLLLFVFARQSRRGRWTNVFLQKVTYRHNYGVIWHYMKNVQATKDRRCRVIWYYTETFKLQ